MEDSVIGIYCHWNGSPMWNGRILHLYYDREKALRLLSIGSLSVLDQEIGDTPCFNDRVANICSFSIPGEQHSFRDVEEAHANDYEYTYILRRDDKWYMSTTNIDTDEVPTLEELGPHLTKLALQQ